jgi:AAA domain
MSLSQSSNPYLKLIGCNAMPYVRRPPQNDQRHLKDRLDNIVRSSTGAKPSIKRRRDHYYLPEAYERAMGTLLSPHTPKGPTTERVLNDLAHIAFNPLRSSLDFIQDDPHEIAEPVIALPHGCIFSFTARAGKGKSAITQYLLGNVASGRDFAGDKVNEGRVICFINENVRNERNRWRTLLKKRKLDAHKIPVTFVPGDHKIFETLRYIEEDANKNGPLSLIIIDNQSIAKMAMTLRVKTSIVSLG